MSQTSKTSNRKSKPSYFMAIMGVAIVLFFVGIFGWVFLYASRYMEVLKEDVQVQVYLRNNVAQHQIDTLTNYIKAQPYALDVEFVDKETAKKRWLSDGGDDFTNFLDENPLPNSINRSEERRVGKECDSGCWTVSSYGKNMRMMNG